MMRIAITGGRGSVGRGVVELALAQGHSVQIIDRAPANASPIPEGASHTQVDLTDYPAVEQALRDCDALVHLAAIPSPRKDPAPVVHNNNVVSNYNVLYAASQNNIKRICLASSVNATGAAFSRWPRYDYFPLDENHPTYNEDPYALSKWIGEQQADSFARRYADLTIASLRLHFTTPNTGKLNPNPEQQERLARDLWGVTGLTAAARACMLALAADYRGHEVFYIVSPQTRVEKPSLELKAEYFPDVPLRGDLPGMSGFYDCRKAEQILGWRHDDEPAA